MPLNTEIHRNGIPVPLRWGWWHLDMIAEAAAVPSPSGVTDQWGKPLYILPDDGYVFTHDFAVCDPYDKEEFFIYAGDVFHAWTGR